MFCYLWEVMSGEGVKAIGGTLCAPHVDGNMVRSYLRRRRRVKGTKVLERIAREGLPAGIQTGVSLESEPT